LRAGSAEVAALVDATPKVNTMMNDIGSGMNGWSGGGMWIWVVAGTLVAVLVGALILRVSRK
jgi:hypothetical protein